MLFRSGQIALVQLTHLQQLLLQLGTHFPGNRFFLPLLKAELERRLAAMPPQPIDPELEAIIPF